MSALAAAAAAVAARGGLAALRRGVPGGAQRWDRQNHRGQRLTLLEGPAWAAGALAGVLAAPRLPRRVRTAAVVAVVAAAATGAVDDLTGTSADKGLRGHLGALASGRVTTGSVKIAAIGASGLGAAALLLPGHRPRRSRLADVLVGGGVIAGTANLLNLLDLRPGRALKTVLAAAPLALLGAGARPLVGAACGAAVALLPDDLGERAMLGDSGANAAGALLGCAVLAGTSARGRRGAAARAGALLGLLALTAASERVSFTAVIERTPGLRELDALGRR